MSKIGRKPIEIGGTQVEIKDNEIHYKGKKASGVFTLDPLLSAELKNKKLFILQKKETSDTNRVWGLNRALLFNKIKGADVGFEKQLKIVGLGFKAALTGA